MPGRHDLGREAMRTIISFIILVASTTGGRTESLESVSQNFSPRTIAAACDTKSALQCQNLLKDCMKNCNTNDNPTICRQICLGQFKGCKTSAGCGGS
jgi:hypothetical protein